MKPLQPVARFQLSVYRGLAYGACGLVWARAQLAASESARMRARERLARWPEWGAPSGALWVHAASLGEMRAARPLLDYLRARWPRRPLFVTTNTPAGREAAMETTADDVRYFPVDVPSNVARVVAMRRPHLFISVETEIWPSLLIELANHGVATGLVSASVSERSFARYRRVRALFAEALARVSFVCARDEQAALRLRALGAPTDRVFVCGDLKVDAALATPRATPIDPSALGLAADVPVLMALSTHDGEEAIVLDAFTAVRAVRSDARLVVAPRHLDRVGRVAATIERGGYRTWCWSEPVAPAGDWDVLIVDRLGAAPAFAAAAAAVFVGGSLRADIGGHNLLEPAALGTPVSTGPHTWGVGEQRRILEDADALVVTASPRELADHWLSCVSDVLSRDAMARRARDAVAAAAGVCERIGERIEASLTSGARLGPSGSRTDHALTAGTNLG